MPHYCNMLSLHIAEVAALTALDILYVPDCAMYVL